MASANGLSSAASRPASTSTAPRSSLAPGSLTRPVPRRVIASHTLSGVSGMSMFFTPACQSASITAFTYAAGEPTVADSPTPFAPSGWCGDGVVSSPRSNSGVSHAVGIR